jgi:hypothetical protein
MMAKLTCDEVIAFRRPEVTRTGTRTVVESTQQQGKCKVCIILLPKEASNALKKL